MSRDSIKVRFVTEDGGNLKDAKKTLSIHVGGLRLEQDKLEDDKDESSFDDDTTLEAGRTFTAEDVKSEASNGETPRLTYDLLLALLFSGTGVGLFFLTIILSILFALPIAMIVIGAIYLGVESCFDERISVILIIGGALSMLSVFTRATNRGKGENEHRRRQRRERGEQAALTWMRFVHAMISLIDAVWFVVASIFVYKIWTFVELDDTSSEFYCARVLYLFSFSYLTICWCIFAATLIYLIASFCYQKCVCLLNKNG